MSPVWVKILSLVFLFLMIFASGFWLAGSGKPYHVILLTFHKLISVGLFVFLLLTILKNNRVKPLGLGIFMLCLVAGLLFLAAIVSGGLLSMEKAMPSFVLYLHRITPFLSILGVTVLFFFILGKDRGVL